MIPPANSQERLIRALACAAITPGLRSILIFDAPPLWLEAIAGLLGRMLEAALGHAPVRRELGVTEDEVRPHLARMNRLRNASPMVPAAVTAGKRTVVVERKVSRAPGARPLITLSGRTSQAG